jgi:hypothetical protein
MEVLGKFLWEGRLNFGKWKKVRLDQLTGQLLRGLYWHSNQERTPEDAQMIYEQLLTLDPAQKEYWDKLLAEWKQNRESELQRKAKEEEYEVRQAMLGGEFRQYYEQWRVDYDAALKRNEEKLALAQAVIDQCPFTVWALTYGAVFEVEDEEVKVIVDMAYVMNDEPFMGYFEVVSHGSLRKVKFYHLVKIEPKHVIPSEDTLGICKRQWISNAQKNVYFSPNERNVDVSVFEPLPEMTVIPEELDNRTAIKIIREIDEKYGHSGDY